MIYEGVVTRIAGVKVYVKISGKNSGSEAVGPLNVIAPTAYVTSGTTSSDGTPAHTHTVGGSLVVAGEFAKGDRVIVAQIGSDKDEFVVLGKLAV